MLQVILIVDDDINDRTLLEHAFRKAAPHIQLRLTKDAFHAEDYLVGRDPYGDRREHPLPSVILLDLKMPRRSGLEFLAWMRDQPGLAAIPVIVLSSSQESSDIDRAYELGARSYLVKSVDLRELISVVQGLGTLVTLMKEI